MFIIAMLVLNALHFTQPAIKMCYRLSHLFLLQEASLFDFAAIKWKLQESTLQSLETAPMQVAGRLTTANATKSETIISTFYIFLLFSLSVHCEPGLHPGLTLSTVSALQTSVCAVMTHCKPYHRLYMAKPTSLHLRSFSEQDAGH